MQSSPMVPTRRKLTATATGCLILALFVWLAPCLRAQSGPPADDLWLLMTNAEDHLSFRYPSWAQVTRPFGQNTTIDLGSDATMIILTWPNPGGQSAQEWLGALNTGIPEPWMSNPRSFRTVEWEGVLVDVQGESQKQTEAILVLAESRVYMITFSAPDLASYVETREVFVRILQTLRFGTYVSSSIDVEQPTPQTTTASQCPGAPFVLPTSGYLSTYYHEYLYPYACNDCNPGCDHTGIDVVGEYNAPVYAVYGGTLYHVDPGGLPCAIRIIHSIDPAWAGTVPDLTVQTYYTHLSWRRDPGAVSQGELIGGQGTCGGVDTHLHLSVSEQWQSELCIANTRDPSPYLGAKVNAHDDPQPKGIPIQCAGSCCGCLPASCCSSAETAQTSDRASAWTDPVVFSSATSRICQIPSSEPTALMVEEETESGVPDEPALLGVDLPSMADTPDLKPIDALPEAADPIDSSALGAMLTQWEFVESQRTPPTSASYSIVKSVFGSGGGTKASAHYVMDSTQGQSTSLSRRASVSYVLVPGYWGRWIPSVFDNQVYLPLVTRNH